MAKNLLDKVRRLRQSDATWLCTARRARTWITPEDQPPYRPYMVLVLEQETERIRRTDLQEERPTPEDVLEVLVKAMRPSVPRTVLGFGRRERPARIVLDDADLVQALAPRLAEIDVRCEHRRTMPLIGAALREMEAHMTKGESVPGLLSVPGATVPLVSDLFTAAADYYQQAPWQWIDNADPIEVRYPPDGRARYAVVLGSGGETYGLSFYESIDDLRVVFATPDPEEQTRRIPWFSLVFEEPTAMSFDDLDAIERYDWPVAEEWAYPVTIKTTPTGGDFDIPSTSEMMWLAAALRVLPDFVITHLRADQGFSQPVEATYPLPGVHGGQEIALRYPVSLYEEEVDDTIQEDEELEEFIYDWYWDEPSHEFARQLGTFLFQFLDDLNTTGLSDRTMQKHIDNCWLIGKFVCDYGYYDSFSPKIFLGEPSYLYEFRRKVSRSKSAVASYKATWRKLARYTRSLGYGE